MDEIFNEFDAWVACRGNGQYASEADILTPIQQIREEVSELVDIIRSHGTDTALEIGLGVFGGSHMLWRLIFKKITTIDNDSNVVEAFKQREQLDERSVLIVGDSKSVQIDGPFDFLHIDGDHRYEGVKADYLKYAPIVRPGGVIAMHDALFPPVKQFLSDLEQGKIDGISHRITRIIHSNRVGYGVEIKA